MKYVNDPNDGQRHPASLQDARLATFVAGIATFRPIQQDLTGTLCAGAATT